MIYEMKFECCRMCCRKGNRVKQVNYVNKASLCKLKYDICGFGTELLLRYL